MSNKPNPNIISEEDFLQSLESGDVREVEKPPIDAGAPSAPPSLPHQTIQTLSGSLPASMQFPTDLIKTQLPGVPSQRLWPIMPAGTPGIASAVTSGTRGISVVANQANKTATSANTTAKTASAAVTVVSSTPVMQVDSGGSVVQAPVGTIGTGGGILTPTLDNLGNGLTYGRVKQTELTSGTVHQLNNGTDVRTGNADAISDASENYAGRVVGANFVPRKFNNGYIYNSGHAPDEFDAESTAERSENVSDVED